MPVKTDAVRNRLVGDARRTLTDAAGANHVLSKAEASNLPADIKSAVTAARAENPRVTVDAAADEYARKVSRVLSAVDTSSPGVLSAAEAKRIYDPTLRAKVLDVRAALLAGGTGEVTGTGGTAGSRPKSADVVKALQGPVAGLGAWWESGDNGVNVSLCTLPKTLEQALAKVTQDPNAPWTHAESKLTLATPTGAEALAAFQEDARQALESFKDDAPADIQAFSDAVTAQFAGLEDVRVARGADLGGTYLLGKTRDGYAAVVVQAYRDG